MESIDDPTNITGISSLLNKKHVNEQFDLEAIERATISGTVMKPIPEVDPITECKQTMQELSEETGFNIDMDSTTEPDVHSNGHPNTQWNNVEELMNDDGIPAAEFGGFAGGDSAPEENLSSYSTSLYDDQPKARGPQYSNQYLNKPNQPSRINQTYQTPSQQPQSDVNDALKVYTGKINDLDFDDETAEEEKAILLEDIDELRFELTGDGVDLTRIPEVNEESPIELVRKVNKILKRKYDRKRCNGFGTELILAGAQGLEYIFDGKRRFGPYNPDLSGWHNTIRPKLRRMKYETSSIVSGIMQEYNIGATARILLELVPSAILYSRMKRDQHGTKNYTPDQMSEAFDELRQFE